MRASAIIACALLALCGCRTVPEQPSEPAFYRFAALPSEVEGKVAVGKEFCVDLEENGTTGYQWHIGKNSDGCQARLEHLPAQSNLCGAPGSVRVHIVPSTKGTHTVRLEYKRHWEKVPPIHTIQITVTGN